MIGVSQNYLCLNLILQFSGMYTFYSTNSADRHKYRGCYFPVIGCNFACTSVTLGTVMLNFELHYEIFCKDNSKFLNPIF